MRSVLVVLMAGVLAGSALAGAIEVTAQSAQAWGTPGQRDVTVYSNLVNNPYAPTQYYFNSQPYSSPQQLGDDLHMTAGGTLSSFKFTYSDPGSPAVQLVKVYFYDFATFNPNGTSTPLAEYDVTGLPGPGSWIVSVNVQQPGVVLPQNIVMSQLMDTVNSGPLVFYPPTIGTSPDNIWAGPPDGRYFTGSEAGLTGPIGFGYEVTVVPEPVALALLGFAGLLLRRR